MELLLDEYKILVNQNVLKLALIMFQEPLVADWKDLPAELLKKIAGSCDGGLSEMRGVCRSWRTDLEAVSTNLSIVKSAIPSNLPERFPLLTALHLQSCGHVVTPKVLQRLQV